MARHFRPANDMPQIFFYRDPVDFRKQSAGLAAIVEQELKHNPFDGGFYAFTSGSSAESVGLSPAQSWAATGAGDGPQILLTRHILTFSGCNCLFPELERILKSDAKVLMPEEACGTVGERDLAAKPTEMYSRRVPQASSGIKTAQAPLTGNRGGP